MRSAFVLTLTAALISAACGGSTTQRRAQPADRDVINQVDINASASQSAYELIQQLRPLWLNPRGISSLRSTNPIMLYVNGNRVGTVARLRDYSPQDLSEIRYLDAISATQRFGTDHRSGAILLFLRRGSAH